VRRLKKIAARSTGLWLLAWAVVGVSATEAHAAEPRVLLLESNGAANSLLGALQIQLSGLAEPERLVVTLGASTSEAIERAGQLVRDHGALAAVWVDKQRHGAGPAVVYVVGEREGRALIEVVRVPGDRGPDLDRTIALKVRELVAAIRRGQAARPEAAQLLQTAREPGPQALPPTAAQPMAALASDAAEDTIDVAPNWAALAFAGIRLGSQPELGLGRWGFGLGAGPMLELRELRLAVLLGFDAFPSVEVEQAGDRVRFWEWAAGTVVRAQVRADTIWLGARLGPQLVGLNAHGTTRRGVGSGTADPTSWALIVGLDLEVPLTGRLSLLAALQLQALASRLHLDVNDHDVVDLGRVRARIGADLAARF
jgi:hypothetical protein